MKKITTLLSLLFFLSFTASLSAQVTTPRPTREGQGGGSDVITKEKGMTIINTTTLADDIEGYAGPTPVKIYINKSQKIEKVEALKNLETPKYFALLKDLLNSWNGLAVKKAAQAEVDVVTGATYSSEAVIDNVRRGIEYYNKNVKK